MIMYHGTNMVVDTIDLSRSRNRVDFGKGFKPRWFIRFYQLHMGIRQSYQCLSYQ